MVSPFISLTLIMPQTQKELKVKENNPVTIVTLSVLSLITEETVCMTWSSAKATLALSLELLGCI
jgi:hypothetical protein